VFLGKIIFGLIYHIKEAFVLKSKYGVYWGKEHSIYFKRREEEEYSI
jgi:hypothetical protein